MIRSSGFTRQWQSRIQLMTTSAGALLVLSACGGGGSSTSVSSPPQSVVNPALAVSTYTGPVAGLGSIIVNGVRFETVGAFVHDGDDPYGSAKYQSVIGLGTTVAVAGNVDEKNAVGSAADIRVVGGLRGKITGIDLQLSTLRVNDQLVKVTNNTVFDGNTTMLAGLLVGNQIEVYGLPQADGSFVATRIESYAETSGAISGVALRGIVASTTAGNDSFTLANGINVSYSADKVVPKGAQIRVGSDVRILSAAAPVSGKLIATKVLVLGAGELTSGSSTFATGSIVKIKGTVDSVSGASIVVSGTKVDIGNLPAPAIGAVVEVKGSLSSVGTIIASQIELEGNGRSVDVLGVNGQVIYTGNYKQELYGIVGNYVSLSSFTVQGVQVDASKARFEYGVSNLANNSYVEIKGNLVNGILVATKVELKGATTGISTGTGNSSDLSSGNRNFEIYATLNCTSYPATCSLTGSSVLNANLSAARWEDGGQYVNGMYVEAKGYLDAKGVFQVIKIEAKKKR